MVVESASAQARIIARVAACGSRHPCSVRHLRGPAANRATCPRTSATPPGSAGVPPASTSVGLRPIVRHVLERRPRPPWERGRPARFNIRLPAANRATRPRTSATPPPGSAGVPPASTSVGLRPIVRHALERRPRPLGARASRPLQHPFACGQSCDTSSNVGHAPLGARASRPLQHPWACGQSCDTSSNVGHAPWERGSPAARRSRNTRRHAPKRPPAMAARMSAIRRW